MYILLNDILQATRASNKTAKETPKPWIAHQKLRIKIWHHNFKKMCKLELLIMERQQINQ